MSQEALAALREGNVLSQTLPFESLGAYHVPFDQLTGSAAVEAALEYWSTRNGKVALIGDSGAGKSSVMAAVLGAFSEAIPDDLVPTRVPVELARPEVITDAGAFGRHVIRHILNWAAPEALGEGERRELERRTADLERRSGRRRRGGFSLGTGNLLPVDLNFQADITGAASDFEQRLQNGDVMLALKRLVGMFRARNLEPFLVFDDTDAWLQLPGQEKVARELATGFFSSNVRMLSRELDCGFAVAIHRSYLELPAYQQVADSLEPIRLPVLEEPGPAIKAIMQRRMDVDELDLSVADAFEPEATAALADLTDRAVLGLVGLTAEIHSTTDYDLTQGWALALQEAGYAGVRYRARHDPRGQLISIALFGASKPPKGKVTTTAIPVELIREASTTFAIAVLPRRHPRRG